MSEAVRVIYIMGAGRSGSTLLDTVLANHPDVVGVGELVNLHSAGWTSNEVCACGKLGTECDFWTRVRTAWQRRVPEATVEGYVYSDSMKNYAATGAVWDEPALQAYLENPKAIVAKSKMAFSGLKKEDERNDLIAFLKTKGAAGLSSASPDRAKSLSGLVLPKMDSKRGRELYVNKGCVACHSINGVGGADACG